MTPFRMKPRLVATPISENVSFSDEGPLLETFEFVEISHGSYQPLNILPYISMVSSVGLDTGKPSETTQKEQERKPFDAGSGIRCTKQR